MTEAPGAGVAGWGTGWNTPGQVVANQVVVIGPNGGEFIYDNSNQLRSANVGADTTDPKQGLTCHQGFSLFNGHGVVIELHSTSAAAPGFFQYFDNNTNVQGSLIYSFVPRNFITDPITSVACPIFGQVWNGGTTNPAVMGFAGTSTGSVGVASTGTFNGWMQFQSATAYRFDGQLVVPNSANGLAAMNVGGTAADSWHTVTLDAGWSGTLRYKFTGLANSVWAQGAVTHAAFTTATNINGSTPVPAAYQPASTVLIGGPNLPTRCGAEISAGGVFVAEPLGQSTTECDINGIYPLD